MLGHGLAIPHMRKNAPNAMHGCVFNATPAYPYSEADIGAAEYSDAEGYHWFMDPVLKGEYPQLVLDRQSHNLPMILEGDLDIIQTDLDFIGINFYTRCVVRYNEHGDIETVPQPEQEHTFIGWEIHPQALTDLLLRLNDRYPNLPPLYITENGAAGDDHCIAGEVNDEQRVRYFQLHLEALDAAIKAGVNVNGYFAWSLMDNFEWAYGYKQRFGIVHVDYQTQKRTLKASAIAYRNMLLDRAEENQ
jgi:beta-glucosidase